MGHCSRVWIPHRGLLHFSSVRMQLQFYSYQLEGYFFHVVTTLSSFSYRPSDYHRLGIRAPGSGTALNSGSGFAFFGISVSMLVRAIAHLPTIWHLPYLYILIPN